MSIVKNELDFKVISALVRFEIFCSEYRCDFASWSQMKARNFDLFIDLWKEYGYEKAISVEADRILHYSSYSVDVVSDPRMDALRSFALNGAFEEHQTRMLSRWESGYCQTDHKRSKPLSKRNLTVIIDNIKPNLSSWEIVDDVSGNEFIACRRWRCGYCYLNVIRNWAFGPLFGCLCYCDNQTDEPMNDKLAMAGIWPQLVMDEISDEYLMNLAFIGSRLVEFFEPHLDKA